MELRTGTLVLVESKTGTHVLVEDRNSRSVGVDDRNSRSVGVDDRNSRSVGVDDRNSPTGPVPHSGADSFDCSARDWDGKDYLRIIPRVVLVEDPRLT